MPLQCFVPNTRRIISQGACLVGVKPTSIKLGQTCPKSNGLMIVKVGETSFPCGELQKCHETDPPNATMAAAPNSSKFRDLQFLRRQAATSRRQPTKRSKLEDASAALLMRKMLPAQNLIMRSSFRQVVESRTISISPFNESRHRMGQRHLPQLLRSVARLQLV
jgi:hypothetical protein